MIFEYEIDNIHFNPTKYDSHFNKQSEFEARH